MATDNSHGSEWWTFYTFTDVYLASFGGCLQCQCFVTVTCKHVQENVFRVENSVYNMTTWIFALENLRHREKKGGWCK